VPSANKIAKDEAKRLAAYVFENFSEEEGLLILEKMKGFTIELIEAQISENKSELDKKLKGLDNLKKTLSKLQEK
jgi:hypothetical protein